MEYPLINQQIVFFVHEPSLRLDQALKRQFHEWGLGSFSKQTLKLWIQHFLPDYQPRDRFQQGPHTLTLTNPSQTSWKKVLQTWEQPQASPAPSFFQIPILYEDEQLLILNKPSGVPSLPLTTQHNQTAVNFALSHCPSLRTLTRPRLKTAGLEPGLVHRLDTPTSGWLVFCKTPTSFHSLLQHWKTHTIQKTYRALIHPCRTTAPNPPFPLQLQRKYLGWMHANQAQKMTYAFQPPSPPSPQNRSLLAITLPKQFHPILNTSHLPSPLKDLEIQIQTGVRHQIRCFLAAHAWPIWGDRLYGGACADRIWLHAWRLILPPDCLGKKHPALTFEAPLPKGWPPHQIPLSPVSKND